MDNIAKYIDLTLLNSNARSDEIIDLCNNAIKYGVKSVCINPVYIMLAKELLKNKNIIISTVIGYPLGCNTNIVKLMEAKDAIEKGADEIDVVINVGALRDGKVQYVLNELQAIKKISANKIVKVIFETGLMSREEIITASKICLNAEIDIIQTTTGFLGNYNFEDNLKLIQKTVENKIELKVIGGIHNYKTAKKFISLGVARLGTSRIEDIMEKIIKKNKKLEKPQNK